jgi:hypothetical protein
VKITKKNTGQQAQWYISSRCLLADSNFMCVYVCVCVCVFILCISEIRYDLPREDKTNDPVIKLIWGKERLRESGAFLGKREICENFLFSSRKLHVEKPQGQWDNWSCYHTRHITRKGDV